MSAEKVFKKYIDAIGGENAINGVKDIKIVGNSSIQGTPLVITEMKKSPGMWKQTVAVSMNGQTMVVQKQVLNGTKAYQEQQGKKADITGEDLDALAENGDIASDLHPEKYGIKRTVKGLESLNGNDAYVIEAINGKGKKSTEYYDATSGLLVKRIEGEGEKLQISEYSDYKEVPGTGYKVPYTVTETERGQTFSEAVQSVDVNKGIPDTEFN